MLAEEAVEEHPEDELLKVPSIDGTTHLACHLPDLAMELLTLLYTYHRVYLFILLQSYAKIRLPPEPPATPSVGGK